MNHKYVARIRLAAGLPATDAKSDERWSVQWHEETREATVEFWASDTPAALIRLHHTVQRKVRGVKDQTTKRRAYYGPGDYVLVSLRGQAGSYDLPRTKNPDMTCPDARRALLDGERSRTGERYTDIKFKADEIIETQPVFAL